MTQSARADDSGDALNSSQVHMVVILWVSYAAFYLGRLNLSPALPKIADSLQIGLGEVGILGNIFFWCYAIGQVISGQLGSIFPPHWIVFIGLLLVAATNIGFAFQTTLLAMGILWGINGFAQSMGWGPILRILSSKTTSGQKRRLALIFSMTFQVGTSLAWGFASLLIALGSYKLAFLVPGIFLIGVAVFWRTQGLDVQDTVRSETETMPFISITDIISDVRHIFPMLLVAILVGFIYIGFLLWLPTLIQDWDFLPSAFDGILTAVIPLIGIPGMIFSRQLLTRQSDLFRTVTHLLSALLVCLILSAASPGGLKIIPILFAVMFASGLAGMLLSAAPMLLVGPGRVSSAGGLITAVWSIAGGLAGSVVGSLVESSGWNTVYTVWMVNAGLAILITLVASHWMKTRTTSQGGNP